MLLMSFRSNGRWRRRIRAFWRTLSPSLTTLSTTPPNPSGPVSLRQSLDCDWRQATDRFQILALRRPELAVAFQKDTLARLEQVLAAVAEEEEREEECE